MFNAEINEITSRRKMILFIKVILQKFDKIESHTEARGKKNIKKNDYQFKQYSKENIFLD